MNAADRQIAESRLVFLIITFIVRAKVFQICSKILLCNHARISNESTFISKTDCAKRISRITVGPTVSGIAL